MKKIAEYVFLAVLVCICLFPSCRRVKIMSEKDMAAVYAEMFLADQWLNDNPSQRRTADTTRFYESIFRKFGYSFEDYDASLNYYLKNPEKFKKILDRAENKLRTTSKKLEDFKKAVERQNKILEGLGYLHLPVFGPDSMMVDGSLIWAYTRDTIALRDSILRDSVVRDSIIRDSILRDSLRRDSLHRDSLAQRIRIKKRVR
jgi:hypothetical protein